MNCWAFEATHPIWNRSGITDYWNGSRVSVGYDNHDTANHVGLIPGGCELSLLGTTLWSSDVQPDPNWELLKSDPAPLEELGFLVFTAVGVGTTGYHDGDDGQRSLSVSPAATWDEVLKDAKKSDLKKYRKRGDQS